MKITEQIIGKAKLTSEEAKVARVYFNLPTTGKRTRKWVEALSIKKRLQFWRSAEKKLHEALRRAGK